MTATFLDPEITSPVVVPITIKTTRQARTIAQDGFSLFEAQINDSNREGSFVSEPHSLPGDVVIHDFHASLGNDQFRVVAIEDPFPLLLIPVMAGVCIAAGILERRHTMDDFRQLARECMDRGGSPMITDHTGVSVTFDSHVKVDVKSNPSFTCVMPPRNQ